jgi:hypothetical protein
MGAEEGGDMRRIESIEDEMRGVVTFEVEPRGERVCVSARAYAEMGLAGLKSYLRIAPSTERLPVHQSGRKIGTMAPDFDPLAVRSTSFLYDPRPGDFVLRDGVWIAAPQLGPGDLESVPGFERERE